MRKIFVMKFTPEEFAARLPLPADEKWKNGVWFINAFTKNDFELEFFAPKAKDHQSPHEKDEIYFVISGTAILMKNGEPIDCKTGDALYVEARAPHHFEKMSDDFATWAIFWKD